MQKVIRLLRRKKNEIPLLISGHKFRILFLRNYIELLCRSFTEGILDILELIMKIQTSVHDIKYAVRDVKLSVGLAFAQDPARNDS